MTCVGQEETREKGGLCKAIGAPRAVGFVGHTRSHGARESKWEVQVKKYKNKN